MDKHTNMTRIALAFDSFKGSLCSTEVAAAFALGLRDVVPDCEVRHISLADGGEGTVEALAEALNAEYIAVRVCDPLGRIVGARYAISGDMAIVEMASASGLTLLAENERNPLITTTYGTGELVRDALARGCKRVVLGLGGSATNDGGSGMLRAMGYRFYDAENRELTTTIDILEHIDHISTEERSNLLNGIRLTAAVDVDNPLYGESGAAHVFARQKGADSAMIERLDTALRHYAEVVNRYGAMAAGAGAAGGLGGGFKALLGAKLERGVDMVLRAIRFDDIVRGSDLVITGEGRIDRQTVMGKAPSGVLRVAQSHNIPVIAIGGAVEMCEELEQSAFVAILPVVAGPIALERAMQRDVAATNVERTACQIARIITRKI